MLLPVNCKHVNDSLTTCSKTIGKKLLGHGHYLVLYERQ